MWEGVVIFKFIYWIMVILLVWLF